MRKIPTLFRRDLTDPRHPVLTRDVTPGCEWVLDGVGYATRKYDGTCVAYLDLGEGPQWWARREVKAGRPAPASFRPVETDPVTGKTVGWVTISESSFYRYWQEAYRYWQEASYHAFGENGTPRLGTYELIGPKINGNPERYGYHWLVYHDDAERVRPFSRTFDGIRDTVLVLAREDHFEGLVWHGGPVGAMAKIKARDFKDTH